MAVTQKQIADRLQISRSLVQHALNGGHEVSASTRERILATAQEMGYDPASNRSARNLVARRYGHRLKTGTIACTFGIDHGADLPFFSRILSGMRDEAKFFELEICIAPGTNGKLPSIIREHNVDGVISMGYTPNLNQGVQEAGLPLVTLMTRFSDIPAVAFDDYDAASQATHHLLNLGHRKIAFVASEYVAGQPTETRLRAYRDALSSYGIEASSNWISAELPFPEATSTIYCRGCGQCSACIGWRHLLDKNGGSFDRANPPFTALVCYNDSIAMGIINQAAEEGIEVPRDLSITSFDDLSHEYKFRPAVTSVNLSLPEMGKQAIRLLHHTIQTWDEISPDSPSPYITVPAQLSLRDSTRPI